MNEKIAYLFDSSCGVTKEDPQHDFYLVPNNILIPENGTIVSYKEDINITQDEITALLEQKVDVKTSLVNPEVVRKKVLELLKTYDRVYYVPISYTISSTYSKSLVVAKEINEMFHKEVFLLIKSNAVSFLALIVMERFKKLYDGTNFEQAQAQILKEIDENLYCGFLLVNNLDSLVKGGRIKKVKGFIAKLLNFKLLIQMSDELKYYDKCISYESQIQKMIDFFNNVAKKHNKKIVELDVIFNGLQSTKDLYLKQYHLIDTLRNKLNLSQDFKYQEGLLPGCIKVHTGLYMLAVIIKLDI